MLMRMLYDESLAQAAYVLGCQKTGESIVVDPLRDVDRVIDLVSSHGLRITAVAETHIHADFVSGSRELAERTGCMVYVSDEGGPEWAYRWPGHRPGGGSYRHTLLRDGDRIVVGNIELRALHTPGHTPEHLCFVVTDRGGGATEPMGIITGDLLFVGDVGRPDLLETAAGQRGAMEPAAHRLFSTLRRLDALGDFVQVWPGHGSGSACGKSLGAVPTSTMGYERRFNAALRAGVEERGFVEFILSGQPEPPLYFATMKRVNAEGPAVLGGLPAPARVPASALAGLDASRVAIVDTRPWESFRAGHLPGSLWLPLGRSLCTNAGSVVRDGEDVYLVVGRGDLEETVRRLIRVGIDRIRGWCEPADLSSDAGLARATIEELPAGAAWEMVRSGAPVLDVRRSSEHDASRIDGSQNIAHTRLASRLDEVPSGRRVLVHCRSGVRSGVACSLLRRAGFDPVNLGGGMLAWQGASLPWVCGAESAGGAVGTGSGGGRACAAR